VHVRPLGRGVSDRVTVPAKLFAGLTTMMEVAVVVPSAGTADGRVAPILNSGTTVTLMNASFLSLPLLP